jgi:hypothetical protein
MEHAFNGSALSKSVGGPLSLQRILSLFLISSIAPLVDVPSSVNASGRSFDMIPVAAKPAVNFGSSVGLIQSRQARHATQ